MNLSLQNQVSVQMMLEISPQYHSLVLGEQQQNVKSIMQHTGAQIMFPDPIDPYTPSLKKSSVTIIGSINRVYTARQMLLVNQVCYITSINALCHEVNVKEPENVLSAALDHLVLS